MALSPLFKMNDAGDGVTKVRTNRQAHPAVTKYRVLNSSSGCSLVELQPLTGTVRCLLVTGNEKHCLNFFIRRWDTFLIHLLSFIRRGEAPDAGSHGVCSVVSHSRWSQILPLEQTGAPGKICLQMYIKYKTVQPHQRCQMINNMLSWSS